MNLNYYIYVYLDPREPGNYVYDNLSFKYKPFYVGKGKNNRIYQGFNDPNNNKDKKLVINDLKNIGLTPIAIKIYDNLSESISYELEKLTIKKIGKNNLTNKSKGSTSHKNQLNIFNLKDNKNVLVNVICIASDFVYLYDGSYIRTKMFFDLFEEC